MTDFGLHSGGLACQKLAFAALGVGVAVVSMEAPFVTFSYFDIVELTAFSSFFLFLLRYIDPKRGFFVEMRSTVMQKPEADEY